MGSSKAGYISRMRTASRELFSDQQADTSDEALLYTFGCEMFCPTPMPVDMQLATDVINYALMRLSFIECKVPTSRHPLAEHYFDPTIAAALMYRHVITKYLRLHAPMKVDAVAFEEMITDVCLSALQGLHRAHRLIGVSAYLVSVAHFYFQRGIPEYVDLARKYFARFLSGEVIRKYGKQNLQSGTNSFALVDIGLVRDVLMAPNGAGTLATYYDDE